MFIGVCVDETRWSLGGDCVQLPVGVVDGVGGGKKRGEVDPDYLPRVMGLTAYAQAALNDNWPS
jgi:hypothetical protein